MREVTINFINFSDHNCFKFNKRRANPENPRSIACRRSDRFYRKLLFQKNISNNDLQEFGTIFDFLV